MRFAPLLLIAFVACGPASAGTSTIEIDIEHSRFAPGVLDVESGDTVTFVVRNGDPIAHEFLIGDEEMQRIHESGTEAHHGARPGEISLRGGETVMTTYTFEEPGELIFGCHLPGHYAYGMRGRIVVGD